MDIVKNKSKYKKLAATSFIGIAVIFAILLATTESIRESTGWVFLVIGVNMIMPEPSFDWGYFVFPMSLLIYYRTDRTVSRNDAVLLAYALSFPVGALLLLVAVALLGPDEVFDKVESGYRLLVTNPLFILFALLMTIFIVSVLVFDWKFKKKNNTRRPIRRNRKSKK